MNAAVACVENRTCPNCGKGNAIKRIQGGANREEVASLNRDGKTIIVPAGGDIVVCYHCGEELPLRLTAWELD